MTIVPSLPALMKLHFSKVVPQNLLSPATLKCWIKIPVQYQQKLKTSTRLSNSPTMLRTCLRLTLLLRALVHSLTPYIETSPKLSSRPSTTVIKLPMTLPGLQLSSKRVKSSFLKSPLFWLLPLCLHPYMHLRSLQILCMPRLHHKHPQQVQYHLLP